MFSSKKSKATEAQALNTPSSPLRKLERSGPQHVHDIEIAMDILIAAAKSKQIDEMYVYDSYNPSVDLYHPVTQHTSRYPRPLNLVFDKLAIKSPETVLTADKLAKETQLKHLQDGVAKQLENIEKLARELGVKND